ncbi:MAG: hypothetical protein RR481_04600, partial [Longicatena sp.]
ERTCEICGTNHEREYDIDKAPILPCHPGCRCTCLPVIDNPYNKIEKKVYNNIEKTNNVKILMNFLNIMQIKTIS